MEPRMYNFQNMLNVKEQLETSEGSIKLLISTGFIPSIIDCPKCHKQMKPRRITACHDGFKYVCIDTNKCCFRTSMKQYLTMYCPSTISLHAYANIVFEYFPDGANAVKLIEKLF